MGHDHRPTVIMRRNLLKMVTVTLCRLIYQVLKSSNVFSCGHTTLEEMLKILFVCVRGIWVWMGVERPCPLVCDDVATPRHLFLKA